MDASFRVQKDKEEKWSWERSVEHGCSQSKPEGQAPLGCESHIFFASCEGGTASARRTDGGADQTACAASCYSADESTCGCSAANPSQVALPMRAALHKNTGCLYGLP